MRIGYPCINRQLKSRTDRTFRLASYTDDRFRETVRLNLEGLREALQFNADHGLLFFRISSETIPFGGHPVCRVDWEKEFRQELESLGHLIQSAGMRISMHPDQFVLLNAENPAIVEKSLRDLDWHERFLTALGLGPDAKIQIHVGGIYGDKPAAMARFITQYEKLPKPLRRRLVIENDDRLYSLADGLTLHRQTGVPILFDSFHHACLNNGESLVQAIAMAASTWQATDGPLMMDYSSQKRGARLGAHADQLDEADFGDFLKAARHTPLDVMLEIKDKEASALRALALSKTLMRTQPAGRGVGEL